MESESLKNEDSAIIYVRVPTAIIYVRVPKYLKARLEAYCKLHNKHQQDVIANMLADMLEDIAECIPEIAKAS